MKIKVLLMSCMTMLCINMAYADCSSSSNLCYANVTRPDGTIIRRGYYYPNGYGTATYVDTVNVMGCADGYYMPTNASKPKCTGGATTMAQIAIDECCWPCPTYDGDMSYQSCYHNLYGTDIYVSQCDGEWCRGSVSGKDLYGGIQTCLVNPEEPDGVFGGDKTGEWQMSSACRFNGTESDVDSKCNCYPRTDYVNQYCAS